MSLPPRQNLADWSGEIGREAEKFMNAEAKFYDSGKNLKLTCKARVQHLRSPIDISSATALGTKRNIRLQIPLSEASVFITKGWLVQIEGGNDPSLEKITLSVTSAINSSHAAIRTVEAQSELAATPRA